MPDIEFGEIDNPDWIQKEDANGNVILEEQNTGQTFTFQPDGTFDSPAVSTGESVTETHPVYDVTHPTYGAVGDGTTDDYAAIQSAIDAAGQTGGRVYIPGGQYRVSQTLTVDNPCTVKGDGYGQSSETELVPDDDITGLHITSGGVTIKGLSITGGGTTSGDGVHLQGKNCTLESVDVSGFARDGIRVEGISGNGTNANEWEIDSCSMDNNGGSGLHIVGNNANAGVARHIDSVSNSGWGIEDDSLLGNTYISTHTAANTLGPYTSTDDNSHCIWVGVYAESGQGPSELSQQDVIIPTEHPEDINGIGIIELQSGPNALEIGQNLIRTNGTTTQSGVSRGFEIAPDSSTAALDDAPSFAFRPDSVGSNEYIGRYHVPSFSGSSFQTTGGGLAIKSSGGSAYDATTELYASDANGTFVWASCDHSGLIEFFAPDGTKTAEIQTDGTINAAGPVNGNVTF